MTEIRPIRPYEAEEFLRLLCVVFDLDFDRAHGIFFNEPLFDLRRKWAIFENSKIVSILTTVPLEFGWGNGIGIAGVATDPERQGEGLAGKLIQSVITESEKAGEGAVYLFAKNPSLYSRLGFEPIDEVYRASIAAEPVESLAPVLTFEEVEASYREWSMAHPNRLRRNAQRWKFWKWNLRICTPLAGGYICQEGLTIREVVAPGLVDRWRLALGSEWFGTKSMAAQLQVPLLNPSFELHFMAYKSPSLPQIFMTDQF